MSDVLKVRPMTRIKLTKNTNKVLLDHMFEPAEMNFTSFCAQIASIGTNASRTLDQGAITVVRHAMIQIDNPANLKINASATVLPLGPNGLFFVANSSIVSTKVINNSNTLVVSVNYVFTN